MMIGLSAGRLMTGGGLLLYFNIHRKFTLGFGGWSIHPPKRRTRLPMWLPSPGTTAFPTDWRHEYRYPQAGLGSRSRVFLAPWSRSRSKKNTRSRSRLGKNQEPEPEPLKNLPAPQPCPQVISDLEIRPWLPWKGKRGVSLIFWPNCINNQTRILIVV